MNFSYEEYFFVSTVILITYLLLLKQKQNRELKKENHILKQYKEAVEESNIVSKADLKGNITYVNDKFCEVTLYERDEIINKPHSLLKGENSKETFKELWETISNKKTWHGVLKNRRKDGEFYYVNITIKPILDEDNEILEYIAIRHEITDLIHKSVELEKSLREDFLTKEGNRFKLLEDIKKSKKPSLALLDVNRFGEIKDELNTKSGRSDTLLLDGLRKNEVSASNLDKASRIIDYLKTYTVDQDSKIKLYNSFTGELSEYSLLDSFIKLSVENISNQEKISILGSKDNYNKLLIISELQSELEIFQKNSLKEILNEIVRNIFSRDIKLVLVHEEFGFKPLTNLDNIYCNRITSGLPRCKII